MDTEKDHPEIRLWIEQEAIHLKAIDPMNALGDPVELTKKEAISLANELIRLSEELDS